MARSLECTNPDLDMEFFDFYQETCEMLSKVTNTENKALILGGEGILGLEAACASLTEPGDRVLVIDNGWFWIMVFSVKDLLTLLKSMEGSQCCILQTIAIRLHLQN